MQDALQHVTYTMIRVNQNRVYTHMYTVYDRIFGNFKKAQNTVCTPYIYIYIYICMYGSGQPYARPGCRYVKKGTGTHLCEFVGQQIRGDGKKKRLAHHLCVSAYVCFVSSCVYVCLCM